MGVGRLHRARRDAGWTRRRLRMGGRSGYGLLLAWVMGLRFALLGALYWIVCSVLVVLTQSWWAVIILGGIFALAYLDDGDSNG